MRACHIAKFAIAFANFTSNLRIILRKRLIGKFKQCIKLTVSALLELAH